MATNFEMFIGEDKTLEVTIFSSSGPAENITGWSLSWMLKKRLVDSDANAEITKTVGSGVTLTDPTNGKCEIALVDTDTDTLKAGDYPHELKRMDDGAETVVVFGVATLKRGVHRS